VLAAVVVGDWSCEGGGGGGGGAGVGDWSEWVGGEGGEGGGQRVTCIITVSSSISSF
jgi:hypothetical protein